ncbi:MAG: ribosome-associated translation inhibitor RaiA, partial [Clostridia bacterium]|nr:ribosome-associated translation inhibitor RaiA [Clostridia bacterium]
MKLTISGKQMNVRQSLRELTEKKFAKFDRFFRDDAEGSVVFSCRHDLKYIEVTVLSGGTIFRSEVGDETFENAVDRAVDALYAQIRK